MITPEAFITEARGMLGVPFVHQGHGDDGVDCMGLLYVAARRAGLRFEDRPEYAGIRHAMQWNYGRWQGENPKLLHLVEAFCKPALMGIFCDPPLGSIVMFRFRSAKYPQHFAICAGETIIHAWSELGKVVEHGLRAPWTRWAHSAWLLPGIAYPEGISSNG